MSFTWLPVIVLKLTSSACFANNQGHGGKNIQIVDDYVKHMLSEMPPDWPSIKEELIEKLHSDLYVGLVACCTIFVTTVG